MTASAAGATPALQYKNFCLLNAGDELGVPAGETATVYLRRAGRVQGICARFCFYFTAGRMVKQKPRRSGEGGLCVWGGVDEACLVRKNHLPIF